MTMDEDRWPLSSRKREEMKKSEVWKNSSRRITFNVVLTNWERFAQICPFKEKSQKSVSSFGGQIAAPLSSFNDLSTVSASSSKVWPTEMQERMREKPSEVETSLRTKQSRGINILFHIKCPPVSGLWLLWWLFSLRTASAFSDYDCELHYLLLPPHARTVGQRP